MAKKIKGSMGSQSGKKQVGGQVKDALGRRYDGPAGQQAGKKKSKGVDLDFDVRGGGKGFDGPRLPVIVPREPDNPDGDTDGDTGGGGGTSTDDGWAVADWMLTTYGFTAQQRASLRNQLWGANSQLKLYTDSSMFGEMLVTALYSTAEFQDRFPSIAEQWRKHQSDPTIAIWSPDQVMKYEQMYDSYLPQDTKAMFDKKKTVTDLILGGVDPDEFRERVDYARWASATAPDSVRRALSDKYGITGGNLMGFYLDPGKGEEWLKKQTTTAAVRAAGLDAGIDLSWDWAERAGSTLGIDYGAMGEINQRMQQAQLGKNLSTGLGGTVDTETRANAAVLNDANARRKVAEVAAQRQGRFNTTGGATESNRGVSGLRRGTSS